MPLDPNSNRCNERRSSHHPIYEHAYSHCKSSFLPLIQFAHSQSDRYSYRIQVIPTVFPIESRSVPAPDATVTSDSFRLLAGGSDVTGQLGSAATLFGGRSTGIIWRTQNGGQGFQLDPASCQLKFSAGRPAYADALNPVIFADTPPQNYQPLICKVDTLTKLLVCNMDDGAPRVNYECQALFTPNVWHVNDGLEG